MQKRFQQYVKREFGIDISFKKSLTPDTFESLFGVSFLSKAEDTVKEYGCETIKDSLPFEISELRCPESNKALENT